MPHRPSHYVEWSDRKFNRHREGPLGGYEAIRRAKELVKDRECIEVEYIAATGKRYGKDEIIATGKRKK